MWVQHCCQTLLYLAIGPTIRTSSRSSKHARNLREYADGVHRIYVGDDIRIRVLIFEEEGAEVGLPALHHFFYGGNDSGVPHNDSFIKAREKRATSDRESKHLWVNFGDGLLGY